MVLDAFYLTTCEKLNLQQVTGIVFHQFKAFLKDNVTYDQCKQACRDKIKFFRDTAKLLQMEEEKEHREWYYSLTNN